MTGLLAELGPVWAWVLAGLVLMGGELVLPGVFLVWLGIAALLTGGIAALDVPWQAQLTAFALLSVAAVVLATRLNRRPAPVLNRGAHRLIGREFVLDAGLRDGHGQVRIDDTLWRVAGPDLPAGTRVRVTGAEGTVLRVAAA